ncbi:MAG: DNA-directed RNA polymerase subunit beta', partial [Candidatus Shikimatogenerans bostrichidophilus]
PPDLRPLVPLEGGKYATSDLNDFYRKIIISNNRLKKLLQINAPKIILKNEKRMLQENVDSLFDNSKKIFAIKSENRKLKSLSDILKSKLGILRLNLLGKRVDYSGRSVIVVEPNLKLYECGLPKNIAVEIYKPFLINKLVNLGIVDTIESAKQLIINKKKIIWKILKLIIKQHPILLNRAPTLHKLNIQAFFPKLINGKAIKLHPLVCSAFNADFDGDQMAVHLPLSKKSILETQLLLLSTQNILNISNGNPIIYPTQDIILGLYYITIYIKNKNKKKIKIFSTFKEVIIAYNLKIIKIHDNIKLKYKNKIINTTVGRVIFNNILPKKIKNKFKFINTIISNNNIKEIIKLIYHYTNVVITTQFLDNLKNLGFYYAFKAGYTFNIKNIITPNNKKIILYKTIKKINKINKYYNMGLINYNNKNYKISEIWNNTINNISNITFNNIKKTNKKLNSIYYILKSGARSTKIQIRQLSGIRGYIDKMTNFDDNIDNDIPIISNYLEGLTSLEYFISTHGSRKGLTDTALKTADSGYLTRRLIDSAQNIIITEYDCKTIKGIKIKKYYLSNNELFGKFILYNVVIKNKIIIKRDKLINYEIINKIIKYKNKIKYIIVRSPLTCDSKNGICAKCYGSNLSNNKIVNIGDTVGIIAAQSIGEPGTQLTLRTFHIGGIANNYKYYNDSYLLSNYNGNIKLYNLNYIKIKDKNNNSYKYIVISRNTKFKIYKNNNLLYYDNIPYGSIIDFYKNKIIKKGDIIYRCNPYYTLFFSEYNGIIKFKNIIHNITYKIYNNNIFNNNNEKIIIYNKQLTPNIFIINNKNKILKKYILPIGAYLNVNNNQKIKKGKILFKIPILNTKTQDITGGIAKISNLFEARNYNDNTYAVISDIDGIVKYGKIKNNKIEISINNYKQNIKFNYLININSQILVFNNEYIKYGRKISEGYIPLKKILYIKGLVKFYKIFIKKIQNIYISQGVKINNKHFEIIVNQMLKKVKIINCGDTKFIDGEIVDINYFFKINNKLKNKVVIVDCKNNKKFYNGKIIDKYKIYIENEYLKLLNKKLIITRKVIFAIAKPTLQGISKAALNNSSFISSASFQETTKVFSESALSEKIDNLKGLKENVIIGKKIPAGTGIYKNKKINIYYKNKNNKNENK